MVHTEVGLLFGWSLLLLVSLSMQTAIAAIGVSTICGFSANVWDVILWRCMCIYST